MVVPATRARVRAPEPRVPAGHEHDPDRAPLPVNERALALDVLLEYRGLDHPSLVIGSAITRGLRVRHATGPQTEYYSKGTASRNEPYDTSQDPPGHEPESP